MSKQLNLIGVFGIMLASSLTIMVGSAITPALPSIGEHFQAGDYTSWLVTIPALGVVIGAIPCGKLLSKIGAYRTCTLGLLLYGALGFLGSIMPELISEFSDRFLLGIATAMVMVSSTALISIFYQGKQLLKMIAIQGMAIELGGVIFLSIGGQLAELSWQMPYMIYGIAFIALILMLLFVPRIKEIAVEKTSTIQNNTRQQKEQNVTPVLIFSFLGMLIFFTAIVSLPSYLQIKNGYSTTFTGNYLAAISLVAVIFAGIMPRIVGNFSAKITLTIAYACYAIAHLLFFFSSNDLILYMAALIMGIGFGFSTPLLNNLTIERSNSQNKARNLSFYSMCTFLGQFCSSMIATFASGNFVFITAAIVAGLTCLGIILKFDRKHSDKEVLKEITL